MWRDKLLNRPTISSNPANFVFTWFPKNSQLYCKIVRFQPAQTFHNPSVPSVRPPSNVYTRENKKTLIRAIPVKTFLETEQHLEYLYEICTKLGRAKYGTVFIVFCSPVAAILRTNEPLIFYGCGLVGRGRGWVILYSGSEAGEPWCSSRANSCSVNKL